MIPIKLVVLLLAVVAAAHATEATASAQPRVVRAARANPPPTIDGKLDDACWKQAEPITGFLVYQTSQLAAFQSFGYVGYDDVNLYLGMKCMTPEGTKPVGEPRPHDSNDFWGDERVEIMLDPGRSESNYFQLAINAYGATWDCSRSLGGPGQDFAWNGEWQGASYLGEDYWSVELAVPYHNLGITPGMGADWGLNLCRGGDDGLSSIGVRGVFNDADKFAVLKDLDADLGKYFFRIEPSYVAFEPTPEQPGPVLNMRVTNMTGKPRSVRIDIHGRTGDDNVAVESEVHAFDRDQSLVLELEPLAIDPIATARAGLRTIRVEPKTGKVVVTDAETGTVLSLAHVRNRLTWIYEAMRLEVDSPRRKQFSRRKTREIPITVHTFLPEALRKRGELVLTLTSRATGEVAAERNFASPAGITRARIPGRPLRWGAYDVRAVFKDGEGLEVVSAGAPATVLPGGRHRIKRLNNVTSELMNARERGLLDDREIEFMNPRDGWCFFLLSGDATATLDTEEQPLAAARPDAKPREAMRRLPAGRHVLRVDGVPDELVVRAIPEILLHEFGGLHRFSDEIELANAEFYDKYVTDNVNTFVIDVAGPASGQIAETLKQRGRRLLSGLVVPEARGEFFIQEVDDAYKYLSESRGFTNPVCHGAIADEFLNSEPHCALYADAVRKLKASPEFGNRLFYAYALELYSAPEGRELVRALIDTGTAVAWERYLKTPPNERAARVFLKEMLVGHARKYRDLCPGSVEHLAVCFGFFSAPGGHMLNTSASADHKTYLDMQFNIVANDPVFEGTYGLMGYHTSYSDEETLRWMSRLFRHYGIEGRTEPATDDPYELPHLVNGDFVDGLEGWQLAPAEENSIRRVRKPGLSALQTRYNSPRGDTALVTKRSANGPNIFSQTIRELQPGRLYTFRMITADHGDISARVKHPVKINLEEVALIPGKSVSAIFPHAGFVDVNRHENWLNYHWRLFRAEGESARLTITDWAEDTEPGGPIGQELLYNFISVRPYLPRG